MTDTALNTLPLDAKGPVAPPPALTGDIGAVAAAVSAWPGVIAATHWHLYRPTEVDGIDFYVGEAELGHIHLDGDIHLATSPSLGRSLIAAGQARPFPYARGWVSAVVPRDVGVEAATALFRANYDRLTAE